MPPRNKDGARPLGAIDPNWVPVADRRGDLQRAVRADLLAVFAEHRAAGTLPRSPRGAFYDLMPKGRDNGATYVKPIAGQKVKADHMSMQAHPDYVSDVLEVLRRQGLIPEDDVADARAADPVYWYGDEYNASLDDEAKRVADYVDGAADDYCIAGQARQEVYLELFVEAEGMMDRMKRVAGRYGVPIFAGSGYAGLKGIRRFATRAAARDVPTVVMTITDYDEHGLTIAERVEHDAVEWFNEGPSNIRMRRDVERQGGSPGLEFVRIGITPDQAARYPERQDALGHMQAEGMPVTDMDALVQAEVEARMDLTRLERVRTVAILRREVLRGLILDELESRK